MSSDNGLIELNVGGVFYTTSVKTISNEPDSFFAKLLQDDGANGGDDNKIFRDSSGKYFIDRDGVLFRYVLDYLRTKSVMLPENFNEKKRLRCEAEFYKLKNMIKLIDEQEMVNGTMNSLSIDNKSSLTLSNSALAGGKKKLQTGCIVLGYRGTFANGRDGLADVKFRKISRILVCGRVQLCRDVFGDTLNESRDPDHGVSDRYTCRFYLKHTFIEQAFDTLAEANFKLICAAATGTNSSSERDIHNKNIVDHEENRWQHYNEFVFIRA